MIMTDETESSVPLPPDIREGLTCWALTGGLIGCDVQVVGVAEALGFTPELKHVSPPPPFRWLAPYCPAPPMPGIAAPWPDLLIACGRQAVPFARAIRRRTGGRTYTVFLQDPRIDPSNFDLVWAPAHDRLEGPNVISTLVSPHGLTRAKLAAETARIAPEVAHLPHPRVAVLLGGTNSAYTLSEEAAARIGTELAALAEREGAGLMVTASRRTGAAQEKAIRERIAGTSAVMWDGTGLDPYFGYLGSADAIVVTCDSVNMVGEATFAGKPVHVIEMTPERPHKARKFRQFLDALYVQGAARPFQGHLERWECEPLNATNEIAQAIAAGLTQHIMRLRKG
ncbi:MAG: hypothetical protein CVT72_07480 [Alphaproteobacteria bacterium HGW-Alphaproteobacteria-11]|nr:MAG: hypothetical protein CVT72_07480 [Alphaproteobacteria bacterium HGW-Alphaproteobacteria-11]